MVPCCVNNTYVTSVCVAAIFIIFKQPRFQGLSSLPPLPLRKETLVAAGHVAPESLVV